MAEPVKLTVIGGGSSSFVPALIRRLIQSDILGDATLTLMDVNERRVRTMEALAQTLLGVQSHHTGDSCNGVCSCCGFHLLQEPAPPLVILDQISGTVPPALESHSSGWPSRFFQPPRS